MSQSPRILDFTAIRLALYLIKPKSLVEAVQRLWQAIVGAWFPVLEGYHCAVKAQMSTNNNMPDIILQILALRQDPTEADGFIERCILQVKCQRPSLDTLGDWRDTTSTQFLDSLEATSYAVERLHGAVAIGKKVQFYRYDGRETHHSTKLAPLHNGPIDMDDLNGLVQDNAHMAIAFSRV
ncbi:predicted protein [Aspergillus terreus NIH2624]|uniref:Fungal-type protein kinase domain-containing protein n=1 Tax=Aspergillus terreus (strain NIH 2624 / FGSC A1156) TaxID=341663 RepID=Q0CVC8_ASPTN|nr:uncharacterized protein ATEG_02356 [Aspergillus terreus NIH2624]EAU37318.1 predicted protein [Aspergillus terreus NIH2624]